MTILFTIVFGFNLGVIYSGVWGIYPAIFTMNNKTINITLSLAQADVLLRYLKHIADSIEGQAIGQVRPMTNEEDLLVSALSWMFIEITGELNSVKELDILEQRASYNQHYREELERQARDN